MESREATKITAIQKAILREMPAHRRCVTYFIANGMRMSGFKFTQKSPASVVLREIRKLQASELVTEYMPERWWGGRMREFVITDAGIRALAEPDHG
jgi:hypothetical protein